MTRDSNDFHPDEFLNRRWKVFDGDAGGGYGQGVVTFAKNADGTYQLRVDKAEVGPLLYKERTRTLELADGSRAISFWDGATRRIFGARKGVNKADWLPFEERGTGSWGAEEEG